MGAPDICVMYTPQARPGLTVEPLLEERLVMVSTRAESTARTRSDYMYVDWGPEFFAQHCLAFPNFVGRHTHREHRLARAATNSCTTAEAAIFRHGCSRA